MLGACQRLKAVGDLASPTGTAKGGVLDCRVLLRRARAARAPIAGLHSIEMYRRKLQSWSGAIAVPHVKVIAFDRRPALRHVSAAVDGFDGPWLFGRDGHEVLDLGHQVAGR